MECKTQTKGTNTCKLKIGCGFVFYVSHWFLFSFIFCLQATRLSRSNTLESVLNKMMEKKKPKEVRVPLSLICANVCLRENDKKNENEEKNASICKFNQFFVERCMHMSNKYD